MTITVNLNDESMKLLQSAVNVQGISMEELLNVIITKQLRNKPEQEDPYEENFNMFIQSLDEFSDDFMSEGRMQGLPQERESL